MKKYFKISILLMGFLFTQSTFVSAQCPIKEQIMGSGEEEESASQANQTIMIYYDRAKGSKALMNAIEKKDCTIVYEYKKINGVAIKIPKGWDVDKAVAYFKKVKGVKNVSKDGVNHLQ
ncbi:S8 family serine peptidase [Prevotella aurantiaca]|uniref:S8 family serine peptidase n=1 Tax=Prevotella aurantiaca TaxID=596085 RepID=UPI0028DD0DFE|nr:hypothetical protein [Prevotella aurantiaca]